MILELCKWYRINETTCIMKVSIGWLIDSIAVKLNDISNSICFLPDTTDETEKAFIERIIEYNENI